MPVQNPYKLILTVGPGRLVSFDGDLYKPGERIEVSHPAQIAAIGAAPPATKYSRVDVQDNNDSKVITRYESDGDTWSKGKEVPAEAKVSKKK